MEIYRKSGDARYLRVGWQRHLAQTTRGTLQSCCVACWGAEAQGEPTSVDAREHQTTRTSRTPAAPTQQDQQSFPQDIADRILTRTSPVPAAATTAATASTQGAGRGARRDRGRRRRGRAGRTGDGARGSKTTPCSTPFIHRTQAHGPPANASLAVEPPAPPASPRVSGLGPRLSASASPPARRAHAPSRRGAGAFPRGTHISAAGDPASRGGSPSIRDALGVHRGPVRIRGACAVSLPAV